MSVQTHGFLFPDLAIKTSNKLAPMCLSFYTLLYAKYHRLTDLTNNRRLYLAILKTGIPTSGHQHGLILVEVPLLDCKLLPSHRCSVPQLCLTLCDPMECSTPGLPCPSRSPRVCSSCCPLSQWFHPMISTSIVPFSSRLQSFPASGSFLMSRLFASGGQRIGASAFSSAQFSSVTQSCPTFCDPINRSTPGLPVHHQLPEFTQTHVHRVSDAIQPSHPLSSPSPLAPNPSQHQSLFQWVNSSHEVAKVLELQL